MLEPAKQYTVWTLGTTRLNVDIVDLQPLKEMFFRQEKVHLIMNCAAFIVVTTSLLFLTGAVNPYHNTGNSKAHWNHMALVEI